MTNIDFYINEKIVRAFYLTNKRYVVTWGGRGSGKSLQLAAVCIIHAIKNPNSRILAIRGNQNKISESSLETLKDVIKMMGLDEYFIITENTLKCVNGSDFIFYGARNYQTFKSLRGIDLVFVDEATELSHSAWEALIPTIREDDSRFLIAFNPEKEDDWVYQNFIVNEHPEAVVIKLNHEDNPFFPKVLQMEMELDKSRNILKYEHIWLGELINLTIGALWNKDLIVHKQVEGELDKIVVSIDPSVTSKSTSDACGLIVAGSKIDSYYILNDSTAVMSPQTWANKAVDLYHRYEADHITYESNQGGDLVKTVINNIDPGIRCISVHAHRGKKIRAEEILYAYENKQVFHTKIFKTLESEMLTFTGDKKDKSPNALDAMVYALKDLLPKRHRAPVGLSPVKMSSLANNIGRMSLRSSAKRF